MRCPAVVAALVFAPGLSRAQEPKPAFDVISIRPAGGQLTVLANGMRVGGAVRGGPGTDEPRRMTANYIPAIGLIQWAFRMAPDQITGPNWIKTARYDFIATVPSGTTKEQVDLMFQQMLEDRFSLKVHHEEKQFDGFNLVIAKGGLKLKDSMPTDPCALGARPVGGSCPNATYPTGIAASTVTEHGALASTLGPVRHITARGAEIEILARQIQTQLGGPLVVDNTGLTGIYDYRIEFAALNTAPDNDTPFPSLFTALEKDLGLKLQPTKISLDTIIIDHIERPSEN
jgi:uncharacterized protein (TIGR03435 family)